MISCGLQGEIHVADNDSSARIQLVERFYDPLVGKIYVRVLILWI